MTMRTFNAHIEGYKLRRKIEDEQAWMLGSYVQTAVAVAVEHVLGGKKAKSKYVEKPFLSQIEDQKETTGLSDEEKKKRAEQLFMKLKIMQSNFELKKNREAIKEKV